MIPKKTCTSCDLEKLITDFYKQKAGKYGVGPKCIICCKLWGQKNKDLRAKYYLDNKDSIVKKQLSYRQKNRDKIAQQSKKYRENNPDTMRNYRHINRDKIAQQKRDYARRRLKEPEYKFVHGLRSLIRNSLRNGNYKKTSKTYELLGADFATVRAHLIQSAIVNYGKYFPNRKYHTDHIVPCSSAKTEAEFIALQHYTNLQYLTPKDNLKKSDKLNYELKRN